jgi:hypothetical protein
MRANVIGDYAPLCQNKRKERVTRLPATPSIATG